jgi:hypothetical protein
MDALSSYTVTSDGQHALHVANLLSGYCTRAVVKKLERDYCWLVFCIGYIIMVTTLHCVLVFTVMAF